MSKIFNRQTKEKSKEVIEKHYDLPAELYEAFLDPYMQYTCALFEGTDNLDQAQEKKMQLICEKLELREGDKVLDLGGGWGGLANFMVENYGAEPTVVTLSSEQEDYIKKKYSGRIKVVRSDYRDLDGHFENKFDAVSAVGIFEHIGHKNYSEFMKTVSANLKDQGLFLLHTIFTPYNTPATNPWLNKEIFPNGELNPTSVIRAEAAQYFRPYYNQHPSFQDLTSHYSPTLHAWKNKLTAAKDSGKINISNEEYRKWIFYFMSCAGAFRAEHMKVGQFLYKK